MFAKTRTAVGTVFPNLSFLMQPFSLVPGEPGVRFVTMRLYHPAGPGRMEMYSWCLVPKNAAEEYKDGGLPRLHPGVRAGGHVRAGRLRELDQGDPSAGSTMVRDLDFPYIMGMESEPDPDFPGQGTRSAPTSTTPTSAICGAGGATTWPGRRDETRPRVDICHGVVDTGVPVPRGVGAR